MSDVDEIDARRVINPFKKGERIKAAPSLWGHRRNRYGYVSRQPTQPNYVGIQWDGLRSTNYFHIDFIRKVYPVPIGDKVDLYADAFFVAKVDTAEIARLHNVSEAEVYNAIHAWREAGR